MHGGTTYALDQAVVPRCADEAREHALRRAPVAPAGTRHGHDREIARVRKDVAAEVHRRHVVVGVRECVRLRGGADRDAVCLECGRVVWQAAAREAPERARRADGDERVPQPAFAPELISDGGVGTASRSPASS